MKICLILLLFYTGIHAFPFSGTRKYYLILQNKTWSDAQTYCQSTHTDLAIIKNTDDVPRIQDETWRHDLTSSAWIGLFYDITNWHWSYRNEPLGNVLRWCVGEPNDLGGIENCAVVYSCGVLDVSCTPSFPFFCFDESKTGAERFIYNPTEATWTEAQTYCRQYYTDLATIRNEEESAIIQGMVSVISWIGLLRDSWKWIDKSSFSTISWMPGEPDGPGTETCGCIYETQATDSTCSSMLPFFCFSDITRRKQVMRVKVQSGPDINHPIVLGSVLEQIRNTLMDHGMSESITVRWREQADGDVFHKAV